MASLNVPINVHLRSELEIMFKRQLELQKHLHEGVDPQHFLEVERGDYIRGQLLALMDELHEAMAEVAWKPWSSDKSKFNREAYLGELIDAWHFMINLVLVAGFGPEEFFKKFMEKNNVNWARHMKPGTYDNTNKCPCGRALDDYPTDLFVFKGVEYHSKTCPSIPTS